MCAKCKLQLSQHLADNQAQNDAPVSSGIHQQCNHFNQKSDSSEFSDKDAFPLENLNSNKLINVKNALHTYKQFNKCKRRSNSDKQSKFNQHHKQ